MKRIGRRIFWVALVAGILATFTWWIGRTRVSNAARENFEWFGSLGIPDVQKCPYVRVTVLSPYAWTSEQFATSYRTGFLLSTNQTTFTVLLEDLRIVTFTNTSSATGNFLHATWEEADLKKDAEAKLADLRKSFEESDHSRVFIDVCII